MSVTVPMPCDNGAAAAAAAMLSLPVCPLLSSFISLYVWKNKNNHLEVRQSDWLILNGEKSQLAGRRNEPH
jgi:hypothetical protein